MPTAHTVEPTPPTRSRILILGAGFGGLTAAAGLARARRRGVLPKHYAITLVNRTPYHLYTPALYEIAAIPLHEASLRAAKGSVCIPLADVTDRFPEIELRGETVTGLDPERRRVTFASGETLDFSYAIVALGSETNFFNIPGLKKRSLTLKTFPEAVRLRNRIEELLRTTKRRERISIVVGGGGATGVEFSAEAVNFICRTRRRATLRQCNADVTLVEASETILPGFRLSLAARARNRLANLGIVVRTNAPIARVTDETVVLKDQTSIPYRLLVWAGGVRGASVHQNLRLSLDTSGRIVVDVFLRAAPGIYAIGDGASFINPNTKRPYPGNVPIAEAGARRAVENIIAELRDKQPRPFTALDEYPFILAVGGKYAIANLIMVRFAGFPGWIVKQFVELRYLVSILPFASAMRVWFAALRAATSND